MRSLKVLSNSAKRISSQEKIMDLENSSAIVAQSKSPVVEFKKAPAQLRPAGKKTVCILNGDAGSILFGITDNLRIIG